MSLWECVGLDQGRYSALGPDSRWMGDRSRVYHLHIEPSHQGQLSLPSFRDRTLGVLEHSSSCCCSNPNEGTLLLCMYVYAVSVDVLKHAVDLLFYKW